MAIETLYAAASGLSYEECCFVGMRFDGERGFRPGSSECWVMINRPDSDGDVTTAYQYGTERWFTGLWRSPAGVTYVVDGTGEVHVNQDVTAEGSVMRWSRTKLPASLDGVFGFDDTDVLVWGAAANDRFVLFRWDGVRWTEVPSPGFDVRSVHGLAPDGLLAGGLQGALASWDGARWTRVPLPLADDLTCVHVAGADEFYATTARGALLEGSRAGWAPVAQGPGPGTPLHAVARWRGDLWIAGGTFGLLRRQGTTDVLEVVKPNLRATSFDTRRDLVICCFDKIAGTSDGRAFFSAGSEMLLEDRDGKALLDFS